MTKTSAPRFGPVSLNLSHRIAIAVAIVLFAAWVRGTLLVALGTRSPFVAFYPAVVLSALIGGFWPGLFATLLSAGFAAYFWLAPIGSFSVSAPVDQFSLVVFSTSGLLVSVITERGRRSNRHLRDLTSTWAKDLEGQVAERTEQLNRATELLKLEGHERATFEERSRKIVEGAPQGMIVVDGRGNIELFNASAEGMFGYAREELLGKSIDVLAPDLHRPTHARLRDDFFANPGPRVVGAGRELFGRRKDGSEFPLEIGLAPIPDRDGIKVVASVVDLSLRKTLEAALRESEAQSRLMFDSIKDYAIVMLDADGKVASWNENAQRMIGYPTEEIVGQPFSLLYTPDEIARDEPALQLRTASWEGRFEALVWRLRKDGGAFQANLIITAIKDSLNGIQGFVTITRDVTEIKLVMAELERSNHRFSIASAAAKIGFWDYDIVSQTVGWDDWMYRLYGHEPLTGRQSLEFWASLMSPEARATALRALAKAVKGEAEFEMELCVITPSGEERHLKAAASVVRDESGTARQMFGVNFDITDLKRAEQRVALERDNAEAANRAKSNFLAMMSHEVRTPMNGVIGMTALLCETELSSPQRNMAEAVRESADALLRILDDILDVSKLEAGRVELESIEFSLPHILNSLVDILTPKADSKGLPVSLDVSELGGDFFIGDPTRLKQVVLNLLSNAIKFTQYGSISVAARGLRVSSTLRRVRVEVSDTGIGISAEAKSRLFRPFEQADNTISRRFGGSGLGLSISRNLVELMGGAIGVDDSVGGGSRFWFEVVLPAANGGQAAPSRERSVPSLDHKMSGRILLAEDNEINIQLALMTLEPIGYAIDIVRDGRLAVEAAARQRYDLILMDMQMPELDGLAATREIRRVKSGGRVPIVAMTANATREDRELCREAGMDDYLAKPVDPVRLRRVAKDWIEASNTIAPAMVVQTWTWSSLPVIDDAAIASLRAMVTEERLGLYLDQCLEQIPAQMADLKRSRTEQGELITIAHTMVGSAGVFGAGRVRELARAVQDACKAGEDGRVDELIDLLDAATTEAMTALGQVRGSIAKRVT